MGWLGFVLWGLSGLLGFEPAHAEERYVVDQRFGHIEFSVSHLGLFTSHGEFRRFDGTLSIDPDHLERTRITVQVDAGSIDMPTQDATTMLLSSNYFDVLHHPQVRFTSTSVSAQPGNHYQVQGLIEIRGVTQSLMLDAALVDRHQNASGLADVADFIVQGRIKRSAFGMTSDTFFISDQVDIRIQAHIQLAASVHAG